MAKNKITDYSATNASNTDLGGIDIQGTGYISNGDNAFREIMTHLAETNAGTYPVADTWSFADPVDLTKIARLDCGSITTSSTRVITIPDRSGVLMTGPSSTTDNGIPRFNGTAGDIQTSDSNVTISDTGGFRAASGSAADPTYSWGAGGDGFYLRTSSSVGVAVDASEIGYWSSTGFTFTNNLYITYGGTGAASQRTALGLGTAAVENVSTSGANLAKMDGNNTWSGTQVLVQANLGNGSAAAPSLALNSATTTGLYRLTTNALGFASSGSMVGGYTSTYWYFGNQTTATPGVSNSSTGMTIDHTSYACRISTASGNNLQLNINNSPSDAVDFRYQGTVKGTISVTSTNTAYNTTSDYRLEWKQGYRALEGSGAFIDGLKPYYFPLAERAGFIAHEFAEVSPASVTGEKDATEEDGSPKYQMIHSSSDDVIAHLVAEMQSLRKRLAALEAA